MPGYVMHLAEVDMIVRDLAGRRDLPARWVDHFMTGNLLPDTRLRGEKSISHFWNPGDAKLLAQAPDLNLFLEKYHPSMEDPLLLGYLTHLHLDARYVEKYWPRCMTFCDSEGRPETARDKITGVRIRKTGKKVSVSDFFSLHYYYGDYTRMNAYFVENFHLRVPAWEDITDFSMDEVRLPDMQKICRDLTWLIGHCSPGEETDLQIFDLQEFVDFIRDTAWEFMQLYMGDR